MSDTVSIFFKRAPAIEVVITAPCVYTMNDGLFIEYDFEGDNVQGFPYTALESFHINKEST